MVHDHDLVRVDHGGEAVRDEDDRVPARPDQLVERLLHESLALGVERTRGLVEQQQPRPAQQTARDGDALLLPAAQPLAALACEM